MAFALAAEELCVEEGKHRGTTTGKADCRCFSQQQRRAPCRRLGKAALNTMSACWLRGLAVWRFNVCAAGAAASTQQREGEKRTLPLSRCHASLGSQRVSRRGLSRMDAVLQWTRVTKLDAQQSRGVHQQRGQRMSVRADV